VAEAWHVAVSKQRKFCHVPRQMSCPSTSRNCQDSVMMLGGFPSQTRRPKRDWIALISIYVTEHEQEEDLRRLIINFRDVCYARSVHGRVIYKRICKRLDEISPFTKDTRILKWKELISEEKKLLCAMKTSSTADQAMEPTLHYHDTGNSRNFHIISRSTCCSLCFV
jgi:hypothetical protein